MEGREFSRLKASPDGNTNRHSGTQSPHRRRTPSPYSSHDADERELALVPAETALREKADRESPNRELLLNLRPAQSPSNSSGSKEKSRHRHRERKSRSSSSPGSHYQSATRRDSFGEDRIYDTEYRYSPNYCDDLYCCSESFPMTYEDMCKDPADDYEHNHHKSSVMDYHSYPRSQCHGTSQQLIPRHSDQVVMRDSHRQHLSALNRYSYHASYPCCHYPGVPPPYEFCRWRFFLKVLPDGFSLHGVLI